MNKRKFALMMAITVLLVCLSACTATDHVDDLTTLELPGIKWGATPEEVKAVLNVTETQILADEPKGDGYRLFVTEVPFFGEEVFFGMFAFSQNPRTEEFILTSVQLYYPDETDMTPVKDTLIEIYGSPKPGTGFTRYKIQNNAVESYTDNGFSTIYSKSESEPLMAWWESEAKWSDVLPNDVQDALIANGMLTTNVDKIDPADPADRELALEYLDKESAVFLYCTDSSNAGANGYPYYTKNVVYFDAKEYMWQIIYYSK